VKLIPLVLDGEDHLDFLMGCLHIGIADKTESVIQQACGNASPPIEMVGRFSS
jgi:hypothetical protein